MLADTEDEDLVEVPCDAAYESTVSDELLVERLMLQDAEKAETCKTEALGKSEPKCCPANIASTSKGSSTLTSTAGEAAALSHIGPSSARPTKPVKNPSLRKCGALLASGKLCPRMHKFKVLYTMYFITGSQCTYSKMQ
jgi:hypothetical protein